MKGSVRPELTLYYRDGCHLCDDMEQQLHELLEPDSFTLRRVDIDEDPELREAYNARVPLLCMTGSTVKTLCEHFLDLQAVTEALASYNRQLPSAR